MSSLSPSSTPLPAASPAADELASLFRLVDRDQSGSISRHELSQLLSSLNLHPASQTALDHLIQACDTNDDGEIDWEEFVHLMNHHHSSGHSLRDNDRGRGDLLDALAAFSATTPAAAAAMSAIDRRSRSPTRGSVVAMAESRRSLGPSAAALSLPMLEKAVEMFHAPTGNRALDERRATWQEMLQQLRVDGAGGFHYQHVQSNNTHPHTSHSAALPCDAVSMPPVSASMNNRLRCHVNDLSCFSSAVLPVLLLAAVKVSVLIA